MPPLVLVTIAWVAGLLAAHLWLVPCGVRPEAVALLLLLPLGAMVLWYRDRALLRSGACASALLLAALRYQCAQPGQQSPDEVAYYNDVGWVSAEGVISGYPDRRDTWSQVQIDVTHIEHEGQVHAVRGTALARVPLFPEYRYGDRVRVVGLLTTPSDLPGFAYREYLAHRGVHSVFEWA
ncbi:MAG TPA: DUF4131 domain-containing protein, partial [Anaerolineae bacterium]|nr:DUF4131 domain-containing protein [Anaerolineae bacterium]